MTTPVLYEGEVRLQRGGKFPIAARRAPAGEWFLFIDGKPMTLLDGEEVVKQVRAAMRLARGELARELRALEERR